MKRGVFSLVIISLIVIFGVAGLYSSFNALVEADFLSRNKYEAGDIEQVYAEKQSNLEAVLVSPALFAPSLADDFEFLPQIPFFHTTSPLPFSVLRC